MVDGLSPENVSHLVWMGPSHYLIRHLAVSFSIMVRVWGQLTMHCRQMDFRRFFAETGEFHIFMRANRPISVYPGQSPQLVIPTTSALPPR